MYGVQQRRKRRKNMMKHVLFLTEASLIQVYLIPTKKKLFVISQTVFHFDILTFPFMLILNPITVKHFTFIQNLKTTFHKY